MFLFAFAWQSTVVLGAAAVASVLLRRRPALAHLVVATGLIATVGCAVVSFGVHRTGVGVLPARSHTVASFDMVPPALLGGERAAASVAGKTPEPGAAPAPTTPSSTNVAPRTAPRAPALPLVLGVWLAASLLLAARAALRGLLEWRLVRGARRVDDAAAVALVADVARELGVRPPELREAPAGVGPALWGWGRRPTIVLPAATLASPVPEQRSIVAHELAHWQRRDQVWLLIASLVVIALPWQPCAWWCRRRLTAASEEACDAWVLVLGSSARSYAGVLARLATQRGARMALSAIGSRRRMHRRRSAFSTHVSPTPGSRCRRWRASPRWPRSRCSASRWRSRARKKAPTCSSGCGATASRSIRPIPIPKRCRGSATSSATRMSWRWG